MITVEGEFWGIYGKYETNCKSAGQLRNIQKTFPFFMICELLAPPKILAGAIDVWPLAWPITEYSDSHSNPEFD